MNVNVSAIAIVASVSSDAANPQVQATGTDKECGPVGISFADDAQINAARKSTISTETITIPIREEKSFSGKSSQKRLSALIKKRALGTATSEENIEFNELMKLKRIHLASQDPEGVMEEIRRRELMDNALSFLERHVSLLAK